MKEGQLTKLIFDRFWYENCHVIRNNTGAQKINGQMVRWGEKGAPDVWIIVAPYGRVVGIECKTEEMRVVQKGPKKGHLVYYKGTQNKKQKEYQIKLEAVGGIYVLAYDLEEVEEAVEKARIMK